MKKKETLLAVKEVAKLLNVSESTMWRMLRERQLQVVRMAKRITRIKRSDIEAYIGSHYKVIAKKNKLN
jgi:excisionase family DNA binding protein